MKPSAKPASPSTITEVTTATSMLIGTTRITTSNITTIKDPYTSIDATVIVNVPTNSSTVDPTSQFDNNNNNNNNNNSNDNNSKSSSVGIILALVVLVIIVLSPSL